MKDQTPDKIRFTFSKQERLCSEKIITALFQPGFSVSKFPLRIHALFTELPASNVQAQVVFVVGKKKFKKAVDRNKIKRLLRELYRMEKHKLYTALEGKQKKAAIAVFYTGVDLPVYKELKTRFSNLLEKFCNEIPS